MTKNIHLAPQIHVRVQLSALLNEALDRAIRVAARRAFKHNDHLIDSPEALFDRVAEQLENAFWGAVADLGVEID